MFFLYCLQETVKYRFFLRWNKLFDVELTFFLPASLQTPGLLFALLTPRIMRAISHRAVRVLRKFMAWFGQTDAPRDTRAPPLALNSFPISLLSGMMKTRKIINSFSGANGAKSKERESRGVYIGLWKNFD
jgi:hypothetical protein